MRTGIQRDHRRAGRSLWAATVAMSLTVLGGAVVGGQAAAADSGRTSRVSISSAERQAAAGSDPGPTISGNGRYVIFGSSSADLVRGDTNDVADLFLRDRWAGTTRRISVSATGAQADGESFNASMSADGRYVTFLSYASNLAADDTDAGYSDIFLRDLWTGATRLIEASRDYDIYEAGISGDGHWIFFVTPTSLVPTDTNGVGDVYLLNRLTGVTSLVSLPSEPGTLGNDGSYWAAISTTGRYVAFCSWATNMVPGDTNGALDVFLRDRVAGTTTRASLADEDRQLSLRSDNPTVSADGRFLAFHTDDPAVVPGDANGEGDVFLRDLRLGKTSAVSVNPAGETARYASSSPQLTPDARYVVFGSWATDLVPNDTNGWYDVFLRDLRTGRTSMVSVSSSGEQGTLNSANPGISADGRHIVFDSAAPNLVPDDTNGTDDVFVRDLF